MSFEVTFEEVKSWRPFVLRVTGNVSNVSIIKIFNVEAVYNT